MNKHILGNLTLIAFLGLVSAALYAESTPKVAKPSKNTDPPAASAQNQEAKNKKADSAYRKWAEEEQERSGHIGASFFEKHNNKQWPAHGI